jgi:hypothetical protein
LTYALRLLAESFLAANFSVRAQKREKLLVDEGPKENKEGLSYFLFADVFRKNVLVPLLASAAGW